MIDLDNLERLARAATPRALAWHVTPTGIATDDQPGILTGHVDIEFLRAAAPNVVLELIARVRQLEADNTAQAEQLLDPDATCCADATRIHKEQREQIVELTARRDELLRLVAQSTPLPDELEGWTDQRDALVVDLDDIARLAGAAIAPPQSRGWRHRVDAIEAVLAFERAASSPEAVLELVDRLRTAIARYAELAKRFDAKCHAVVELTARDDELSRMVEKLAQSTPRPDELAGSTDHRTQVSKIVDLKQRVRELEDQRDEARAQSSRDLEARRNAHDAVGPLKARVRELEGLLDARVLDINRQVSKIVDLKQRARELEGQRDEAQAQSNRDLEARRAAHAAIDVAARRTHHLLDQLRVRDRQGVDTETQTETQTSIEQWRRETFGHTTTTRLAARANLAMAELIDALSVSDSNPAATTKCSDVMIVLFGVAQKLGIDLLGEVDAKMKINRARKWTVTGDDTGMRKVTP